ncbi:DUF3558 family protein [Corynebacterium tuscaniense]|uniref:DUF3558 family protein n=1 Tax=Corynebacterium tuscaniense TaxID=302449 RepID=UPI00123AD77B|nr:DUF3558 family protein [Corynebacterium tuscaniense]KAA8728448.1 DUF3558 domain-containing protein [Corynebacterium tuscaniense]
MHKQITTVITAVATVCLLSSCTATGVFGQAGQRHETSPVEDTPTPSAPDSGSDSAETEVPAFHFASGDLVLGDFDYEAIQDNMFNPCEEISKEELSEVGFSTPDGPSRHIAGTVGCGLSGGNIDWAYAVGTSNATRAHQESEPENIIDPAASDVIPGLFTYLSAGSMGLGCVAAVDTVRGQFSVIVGEGNKPVELDKLCQAAVRIVEDLYQN